VRTIAIVLVAAALTAASAEAQSRRTTLTVSGRVVRPPAPAVASGDAPAARATTEQRAPVTPVTRQTGPVPVARAVADTTAAGAPAATDTPGFRMVTINF
jgi:hypothetical protein